MAVTISGDGTITGISAGGLPNGSVTSDTLASTLDLSGNTITLPSGTAGKVLQVTQGTTNTGITSATNVYVDTGLSASITPSSTSNKILVYINVPMARKYSGTQMHSKLLRDSTDIYFWQRYGLDTNDTSRLCVPMSAMYLDTPATTSAITYKLQFMSSQNVRTVQMQLDGVYSTLTLMEIAG